jgi:hypothetical protein
MLFDKVVCISKWSLEARILVFLAQAQKWPVFNCARLRNCLIGSMEKRTRLWRFWLNATGVAFHRRMIIRRHQA